MADRRSAAKAVLVSFLAAATMSGCGSGQRGGGPTTATSPSSSASSSSDDALKLGNTETPVSFTDGAHTLHGVLVEPRRTGPFPVIVFVHGDGPATRDGYGLYPALWK